MKSGIDPTYWFECICMASEEEEVVDELEEPDDYDPRLLPFLYPDKYSYKLLPYSVAKYELFARVQQVPISPNSTMDVVSAAGKALTHCSEPFNESTSLATFYRAAAASPVALELATEHLGDADAVGHTLRQIEAGGFRLMQRSWDEHEE